MTATIQLSPDGVKAVRSRHPWVYRDHVAKGSATSGDLVRVVDARERPVGVAAWSSSSKIALRFLVFGDDPVPSLDDLHSWFLHASELRQPLLAETNAVRLISSEADRFPGLIIDRYGSAAVVQALTAFSDRLLPDLVAWLGESGVDVIVGRHDSPMRQMEGLRRESRMLLGPSDPPPVEVVEGGLKYGVDLRDGQKTGLFLDQRRNRIDFGRMLAPGARVLDAFTYAGGFAMQAARQGGEVWAYDDSEKAVDATAENAKRNGLSNLVATRGNAFQFLKEFSQRGEQFDAVVLDPPAFARNRGELNNALRGYREINRQAFQLVKPGGLLVTASCSYQLQEPLFEDMLRRSAADAGRSATVVHRGSQDLDHPVLLSLPQSRYLKCHFLRLEGLSPARSEGSLDGTPPGR